MNQTECLQQLNKILLPNLNWFKGLKSWNKVFRFYENECELLKFVSLAEGPPNSYGKFLEALKELLGLKANR